MVIDPPLLMMEQFKQSLGAQAIVVRRGRRSGSDCVIEDVGACANYAVIHGRQLCRHRNLNSDTGRMS